MNLDNRIKSIEEALGVIPKDEDERYKNMSGLIIYEAKAFIINGFSSDKDFESGSSKILNSLNEDQRETVLNFIERHGSFSDAYRACSYDGYNKDLEARLTKEDKENISRIKESLDQELE